MHLLTVMTVQAVGDAFNNGFYKEQIKLRSLPRERVHYRSARRSPGHARPGHCSRRWAAARLARGPMSRVSPLPSTRPPAT
jgi:hypothetical protein